MLNIRVLERKGLEKERGDTKLRGSDTTVRPQRKALDGYIFFTMLDLLQ
jgi:hypothetical protein